MKASIKSIFTLGLLAISLTACGDKQPGVAEAYGEGNNCSATFISDYNAIVNAAKIASTQQAMLELRTDLVEFKNYYANVNCQGTVVSEQSYSSSSSTNVDVNSWAQNLLDRIETALNN